MAPTPQQRVIAAVLKALKPKVDAAADKAQAGLDAFTAKVRGMIAAGAQAALTAIDDTMTKVKAQIDAVITQIRSKFDGA
jgi:hypothetical protein